MARLTQRITESIIELSAKANPFQYNGRPQRVHMKHPFWNVFKRLCDYEDAEEQGLLLRLPIEIRGVDERIIKYALAKAMCLFKYGVDVDSKLEGAVETSYALHQAYMRGSQDAIDEMHKRNKEIRNKAIDEFAEMIELEILTMLTSEQEYRIAKKSLDEIAEQMKGV